MTMKKNATGGAIDACEAETSVEEAASGAEQGKPLFGLLPVTIAGDIISPIDEKWESAD